MRTEPRDGTRVTVVLNLLLALALLCPTAWADQRPTLIRNAALILTMDPTLGQGELGMLAGADVLMVGDKIAAVGKRLPRHGAQVIDATGKIVLPGFVDTHNHLWQSLFFLPDLIAMSNLARELDVKLHVHLLEHISQRADGAFEALALANALGPDLLGAHGIHLTDQEIQILADSDARLMHNPLSNMRLASGVMRLPALRQAGVQVGLGLDGGTNDTSDMFNNMRAALGLQRATSLRADVTPTVSQVLRMATTDGAALLNMSDRIGSLTPGKRADVIVLDPRAVNVAPTFDAVSQIVLNAQPQNVEWVFVDGRALKRGGKLVGVDTDAIVRNAQAAADRIRQFLFP